MSNPFPTGGAVFPLPNQTGQIPPDIQKNFASVYVEAARIPKSSGWFSSDQSLALSFKVVATYLTPNSSLGTPSSTITVTKSYPFDVTHDAAGNVVLPLNSLVVIDTCPLMTTGGSDKTFLSDLTMSVTFLATTESTGFSLALQELFKLSGKLPIPNPYTPYVSLLGDGISDVAQSLQSQDANPQPLWAIGFQFVAPNAKLSGYYVLLMSTDQTGTGFVDTNSLNSNLLGYDPVLGLTYNGVACQNAYVIFRLGYSVNPLPMATNLLSTDLLSAEKKPSAIGLLAAVGLTEQMLLRQIQ